MGKVGTVCVTCTILIDILKALPWHLTKWELKSNEHFPFQADALAQSVFIQKEYT